MLLRHIFVKFAFFTNLAPNINRMKAAHNLHLPVWFTIIGLALASCSNPQPEAITLLKAAEQLADTRPDSAMQLIDSIFYPDKSFNKRDYMRYWVTRVQVRYKNYLPVDEDTLIFKARDYFTKHSNDPVKTTLAYFYSGCVYREQGNKEQTMKHYKDAETYAVKTSDVDLQGLVQYNMGDLLAEQGLYDQALISYQQAESLYALSQLNAIEKHVRCLSTTGRMFLISGQQDSAFADMHKGFELALTTENDALKSLLAQNLSVFYAETAQPNEAIKYLHQSYMLNKDSTKILRYYLNFAEAYAGIGKTDSCSYYSDILAQKIETNDKLPLKAAAYFFLSTQARKNHNYDQAFDYQQKYAQLVEKVSQKRLQQSVYEVQQKYDYNKQQNRYNLQLMHRQRLIIIFISFFLLVSLLSLFLLRRIVIQKNRLLSVQNAVQTLNKTAKDLQERQKTAEKDDDQLRETLLWKFNVLHKSSLLKTELQQFNQMNIKHAIARFDKIVYGDNLQSQWTILVDTIDELHPGLSSFIRSTYPQFTETEFKVCLLSYIGLPGKEIALLINQSIHTVNMARTRIRKKMGLREQGADFCTYLKEKLNEKNTSEGI